MQKIDIATAPCNDASWHALCVLWPGALLINGRYGPHVNRLVRPHCVGLIRPSLRILVAKKTQLPSIKNERQAPFFTTPRSLGGVFPRCPAHEPDPSLPCPVTTSPLPEFQGEAGMTFEKSQVEEAWAA